ncbi:LuxR family transcriptional regulator [Sinomonas sp. ASV486]|uniref:helix-turn-helix transcriptional regulator n=1 Tax=Sinomonas sp. ASV486 TaxID=3051170 RepID=UPI0027DE3A46|nr:LuxR family transcriptional regulator [Sinomonas sp. ASV486]MDQ4490341.1 LuxR family transcriptional regulator [Sinomonas sp. ASV486]
MQRDTAASMTFVHADDAPAGSAERQADRLTWAMLVRQEELAHGVHAFRDPASLGAVVTGPPGVGKSFLASAVLSALGAGVYPLRIRTPSVPSDVHFASLGPLLARLPRGLADSPTKLLVAVQEILRGDAGGLPVVLVVEFGAPLDEGTVGVLLHLLHGGMARLLAIAPRTTDLAADFLRLVRDGRLSEVALRGISIRETRKLVSALMGGRVSASVVAEVHQACGGNPSTVQGIVRREHASGNLHRRGAVWTLDGPVEGEVGAGTDEIIRARWAREPQDVREVIEHLAAARRIPISGLAGLFGTEVLVDMEERHLLAVDGTPRRCAYLREPRMAELVRGRLGPDRHRELASLATRSGAPEEDGLDAEDLISYVEWAFASGGSVGPDLLTRAAHAAMGLFEPQRALDLLDRGGRPTGPAAVGETLARADALSILERREEALAVITHLPPAALDGVGAVERARVAATESELLTWLPEHGDPLGPLRTERAALAAESHADRHVLRDAAEVLDLAEFRAQAFRGEFVPVLDTLEEAARRADASEGFRHETSLLLALAWAACGRELDAAALLAAVESRAAQCCEDDSFISAACFVWIVNGDWKRCLERLETYMERGGRRLRLRGGLLELWVGLSLVMAGQGGPALEPLLNALAQLEEFPAANAERAASAATALAYAQIGDSGEAALYLERAAAAAGHTPWRLEFFADFCELLARRWLGEGAATERLLAHAALDEEAGRVAAAGLRVFAASVPGTDSEFLWIERLGQQRQGPLAHLMTSVAAASRCCEAEALLAAAEEAHAMSLDSVEARCAALALDAARDHGDAGAAGRAQTRLDRLTRILPVLPLVPQVPAPVLTSRERQIADMAASGSSNRDIAEAIGVSVRTVEGHLYQVFMKLGVSSRSGLEGLV